MQISFIGLGKLGTPVAVSLAQKYPVRGYDIKPELLKKRQYPHKELGPLLKDDFQEHFDKANLAFHSSLEECINGADIIFVAVQTPHEPLYEGITRVPDQRADFDYRYLISACENVSKFTKPGQIVVVISTVLPGTLRREILGFFKDNASVVYSPLFIAMGTTMHDFYHPEFVLLGSDHPEALQKVKDFYIDFYGEDLSCTMSIESAELTKVAYNCFISAKIAYVNTLMEICHKTPGCNIEEVTRTLTKATKRLISPKYMEAGMGDGGGCHPRDGIAMSWLAQKLELSFDMFGELMVAREKQAEWLVNLMLEYDLPKVILGRAFKPETNITTGSPAILCANLLKEKGIACQVYDPHTGDGLMLFDTPAVFLIATKHNIFTTMNFPEGSIVLDPFRFVKKQEGVTVIPIGIGV
jgi:UDPglucose 6-dehydrogenase